MSIAVSAVVRSSRLLRAALASFGAINLGAGLALAACPPGSFAVQHAAAGACLLAAAILLRAFVGNKNTRRIDISGLGQLHLTVQQDVSTRGAERALVYLMPGSTLWPQLLLLLLRAEDGAITVLTVLPDSVAPDQFRALAVAVRVVAGRDYLFIEANKKLNLLPRANSQI